VSPIAGSGAIIEVQVHARRELPPTHMQVILERLSWAGVAVQQVRAGSRSRLVP